MNAKNKPLQVYWKRSTIAMKRQQLAVMTTTILTATTALMAVTVFYDTRLVLQHGHPRTTTLHKPLSFSQSQVGQFCSLSPVASRLNMATPDAVGCAMEAVLWGLDSTIDKLEGQHDQASTDWSDANESLVALNILDNDLSYAANRTPSRRFNAPRRTMTNCASVIEEVMPVLARCRYQLPAGVLGTAVDGLSRPVAWRAANKIFNVVLGNVHELMVVVAAIKDEALIRCFDTLARGEEGHRLRLHLRCTCKRLQYLSH